ncbi:hypothetical protein QUF49_07785 [Fictibacillus sp. b24]|uniref:hypothetical protein n=1 Tax=Fictibacillus sp. b24 TaxID=3055863 RepID=UPI00259FF77D|nr:hypothetical protein [Fictibacillus sp. b24]MDM5315889.1 hypothetical protein [Fictibacillus sp. b24]
MFEYWIFDSVDIDLFYDSDVKLEDSAKLQKDFIWYFQSKNVFVIQSFVPFGDGNLALDELLVRLADHYEIHDKGIIKSHWQASSFH